MTFKLSLIYMIGLTKCHSSYLFNGSRAFFGPGFRAINTIGCITMSVFFRWIK